MSVALIIPFIGLIAACLLTYSDVDPEDNNQSAEMSEVVPDECDLELDRRCP